MQPKAGGLQLQAAPVDADEFVEASEQASSADHQQDRDLSAEHQLQLENLLVEFHLKLETLTEPTSNEQRDDGNHSQECWIFF